MREISGREQVIRPDLTLALRDGTGGGGRSASTVYKNWTKLRHCKSEAAEVNRKCCHMVGW